MSAPTPTPATITQPTRLLGDHEMGLEHLSQNDFEVSRLPVRTPRYPNPLALAKKSWMRHGLFLPEDSKILANPLVGPNVSVAHRWQMRLAGPRADLHFNPEKTVIGVVTCGGLCPGLNDVIRGIVNSAVEGYNIRKIYGFRFGYWGLSRAGRSTAMELTHDAVQRIQSEGGSFLGTSRGPQSPQEMVDTLAFYGVNILFTVGGDGTQRGASRIAAEAKRRGLDLSVVGIPKTIDNDISFCHRTFGFETAVEQAVNVIRCAYSEASSHLYGVGLVKVMGRHSGFIAAQAVLASAAAHICLIPESPISEETFFKLLEERFRKSPHCVVVVAEGFGQHWQHDTPSRGKDASGNVKLIDIGEVLQRKINAYMKARAEKYTIATVKYIDPSYIIRACPPTSSDSAFCSQLAMLAVHEGMYGITDALILSWYDHFITMPIKLATSIRKVVDLRGGLWRAVREMTVDLDPKNGAAKKKTIQQELQRLDRERARLRKSLSKL